MNDDPLSLGDFSGTVRLFPLPNLVMFPSVVQPLHIFEPRYRQMLADALEDDRLIGMVLLQPGWEEDYHLRPAIHPVGCLGKVFKEERLADGRYNLLLHGLHRVRIRDEIDSPKLYRVANGDLLEDHTSLTLPQEQELRRALGELVPAWFAAHGSPSAPLDKLLHGDLSLGTLTDVFSFALPLGQELKQRLLEELDVGRRARLLTEHLRQQLGLPSSGRSFPPNFSTN